jgi:hypothetical protein
MAGQKFPLERPRVRSRDGAEEVPLKSYDNLQHAGTMPKAVLKKMALSVSSRDYEQAIELGRQGFGVKRSRASQEARRSRCPLGLPISRGSNPVLSQVLKGEFTTRPLRPSLQFIFRNLEESRMRSARGEPNLNRETATRRDGPYKQGQAPSRMASIAGARRSSRSRTPRTQC